MQSAPDPNDTMASDHPFQMLFETLGRLPIAHAESVNRQAYEILYDILSVPVEKPGRCILLRAPRAGHGKTHLLSRIQHHLGSSHEFIPLHAAFGCQIDAATVIDDSLRRLLRPLPASGGLCVLDLVTRRLFASALQPLVGSGEVPCQDREGALTALRTRPIETFDFHHPNAVTAHWARENFEVLGQRLSVELSQRCGLPAREVAFWVDALFRFAATPVENPIRLRVLAEVVHAGNPNDGVLMERLEALLGMLTLLMRVVLVADDLEGFSTDESAALRLAAFLGELRQSVERLDVVLSLNQDIWQNAFVPRLSGGLADRLSEVVVELNPLTEEEMVALLESRVPGLGARVLSKVDRDSAGTHARGLIRAAGVAWLRASAMDSQQVPAVPLPEPPSLPEAPPLMIAEPAVVPAASPEFPAVLAAPEPEVTVVEPPPMSIPVEIPPAKEAAPPVPEPERTPDPTLAIAFLAASAKPSDVSESWPAPDFEAAPETSVPPAAAEFADIPARVFSPVQESSYGSPAAAFEPAPEVEAFVVAPKPEFTAAVVEEPVPAGIEAAPEPHSAFQPVPEISSAPAFQAVAEPEKPSVPDTDRVDDLLRQFRERYGRGSM